MKNRYRKVFLILLISIISISSIVAQTLSINITKGNLNDFSIYYNNGKKIPLNSTNILINDKTILRTNENDITINYQYGNLNIGANSIVVVDPFQNEPLIYLIDGQLTLDTDSSVINKYTIQTTVSRYEFNAPAKINVISTADLELGVFYKGSGTSYNALTNETTTLNSANIIDMSFPDNITLDIPQSYLNSNINIVNNTDIVNLIRSEYSYKEAEIKAENKNNSIINRNNFLNSNYLFGITPIQKSNNFDNLTTINLVVTGNGQGNISAINLPAFSGIIKEAKTNNENILLIDGGNTLNGTPSVTFDKGKTAINILDNIGYDIFVPGAIDFANGIKNLSNLNKNSNINFISTNALNKDKLFYFNPYGLYLFDDFKIAVLGLSNPSDLTTLMDLNLTDQSLLNSAQTAINEAHKVADYVILINNLNYKEYNSAYILNHINGINLIIDSNNSDATLMNINGTPVLQTGVGYSEIQNYTLNVRGNNIVSTRYAKVYSSNLLEDDNRLLTSLNLHKTFIDNDLQSYINQIVVPSNLSQFLLSPTFNSVSSTVNGTIKNSISTKQIEVPTAPTFVYNPIIIGDIIENKEVAAPTIINSTTTPLTPRFKPLSYSVKKQNVMEQTISNNTTTEKAPVVEYKQANIYSNEDSKIKTHVGLDTTLSGTADILDSTLVNIDYYGSLTLTPYISNGGFSFALRLVGNLNKDLTLSTPIYPLPTITGENITSYALDYIDHLDIESASGNININIDRNSFETNLDSAIVYNSIGGSDLHLNTQLKIGSTQIDLFTTNLNLYQPINNTTDEAISLNFTFSPVDLLNIKVGAIALGNLGTLDVYPSINFDFIAINNKDLTLKFNLGGTVYFNALPTSNFQTILDPSNPGLIPNYLANTSIDMNFDKLQLSLGANYLVTEDTSKFTTNMLHIDTIRSNIFNVATTNTLTAKAKIKYVGDNLDLNLNYTFPINMATLSHYDDLLDISLGFNINNFTLGGFYLLNGSFYHIKDILNIRSFLVNADTEYGGYISYKYNDFTFKVQLALPGSSTIPLSANLSIKYNLDSAF